MTVDVLNMFEQLASNGQAPSEGCTLFGAGYEKAFAQLRQKYLVERFERGASAEKFVIGPFGSGKTHFLRQLMEIGRELDCVTIEVALNKNVDSTQVMVVYKEMAQQIHPPGIEAHGFRALLLDTVRRLRQAAEGAQLPADAMARAWLDALAEYDFASPPFGRVVQKAINAYLLEDTEAFEAAARWLSGEVLDKSLARAVGENVLTSAELKAFAHRMRLSLFQFIRQAGYHGTIVGFDEAEQSMATDKKRMARIFSHLLSEINAINDLQNGSVLVVYAVTHDVIERIGVEMPMLMQRLADPGPGLGFFDGNPLAARVDLTLGGGEVDDLERIGTRLTNLFFERVPDAEQARATEAIEGIRALAENVVESEASSSARREMVKRVCTILVNSYRSSSISPFPQAIAEPNEAEV